MKTLTPYNAWLFSLGPVLLWPLVCYSLAGLLMSGGHFGGLVISLFVGIFGLVIHFIAYTFVGLPCYLLFWERFPLLWRWPLATIVGCVLGGAVLVLINASLDGFDLRRIDPIAFFLGAAYGLVTGLAAAYSAKREKERELSFGCDSTLP